MKINLKKEGRKKRVGRSLRNNLKKRKEFQDKIKRKIKKHK